MLKSLSILFSLLFSIVLWADNFEGFITTSNGDLFVKHKVAGKNAPTFVIVNGLTHKHNDYENFKVELLKLNPNFGIVLFDLRGMGKTLSKELPVNYDLPYTQQIQDIREVVNSLHIKGNKYLTGLSYGGGLTIAYANAFPKDFDAYIPIAPYLEPLKAHVDWINNKIKQTRILFPFNPYSNEELYAYFLRVLVYSTFPFAEPLYKTSNQLENFYKMSMNYLGLMNGFNPSEIFKTNYHLEAVYRMSLGMTKFKVKNVIDNLPKDKMHMIFAGRDEYINRKEFLNLETEIIQNNFRWKSWTEIRQALHKVPNQEPEILAKSILKILKLSESQAYNSWEVDIYDKNLRNKDNNSKYPLNLKNAKQNKSNEQAMEPRSRGRGSCEKTFF